MRLDCSCRVRRLGLRFTGREAREGREWRLCVACDSRSGIGGGGGWFWMFVASSTPASLLKGCIVLGIAVCLPSLLCRGIDSDVVMVSRCFAPGLLVADRGVVVCETYGRSSKVVSLRSRLPSRDQNVVHGLSTIEQSQFPSALMGASSCTSLQHLEPLISILFLLEALDSTTYS